jgi:iron complex transport system substrate-binding protein
MTSSSATRLLLPAALAGWLLAALAAPAAAQAIARATVQATDDTGVTVTLAAPAQRIVSLAPHATELLFAAGGGERVIGVSATSDWPPAARALLRVGDARGIDLERIVALDPDLIVTWPYTAPGQVERLRARGIAVFMTDPRTIEGIAADLERLGTLLGTQARAREIATDMRKRVAQRRAASAGKRNLTVFYEIWPSPLFTIGGAHLISQAIRVCGGTNVFAALALPAPTVSVEAVLAAKPEAIIAAADDGLRPDWLEEWRRWPALPAVAQGNLLVVDGNLLHRPGPRFLDGVDQLCAVLDAARQRGNDAPPVKNP